MPAVLVDDKYRVTIPKEIRANIRPGDVLFVEETDGVLHYVKAENPFDGLARHAIEEYRAGRTRSLAEVAQEEGVDLGDIGGEEGAVDGEGREDGGRQTAAVPGAADTAG